MSETTSATETEVLITDFLLARLDEEHAAARYALSRGDSGELTYGGQWFGAIDHARHWTPTRVLAQCAARQLIINDYIASRRAYLNGDTLEPPLAWVVRILATVYKDHPDFEPQWHSDPQHRPPWARGKS